MAYQEKDPQEWTAEDLIDWIAENPPIPGPLPSYQQFLESQEMFYEVFGVLAQYYFTSVAVANNIRNSKHVK